MELSLSGEESDVEEASQTPAQQHQSRPARKGFQVPRKGTVPGKCTIMALFFHECGFFGSEKTGTIFSRKPAKKSPPDFRSILAHIIPILACNKEFPTKLMMSEQSGCVCGPEKAF